MFFVSSSIHTQHWIKPDVGRIGAPQSALDAVVNAMRSCIAFCWRVMDSQIELGLYLMGADLSELDVYVAVASRFGPWRERSLARSSR